MCTAPIRHTDLNQFPAEKTDALACDGPQQQMSETGTNVTNLGENVVKEKEYRSAMMTISLDVWQNNDSKLAWLGERVVSSAWSKLWLKLNTARRANWAQAETTMKP